MPTASAVAIFSGSCRTAGRHLFARAPDARPARYGRRRADRPRRDDDTAFYFFYAQRDGVLVWRAAAEQVLLSRCSQARGRAMVWPTSASGWRAIVPLLAYTLTRRTDGAGRCSSRLHAPFVAAGRVLRKEPPPSRAPIAGRFRANPLKSSCRRRRLLSRHRTWRRSARSAARENLALYFSLVASSAGEVTAAVAGRSAALSAPLHVCCRVAGQEVCDALTLHRRDLDSAALLAPTPVS